MTKLPNTLSLLDFKSLLLELHDFKNRQYDLSYYNILLRKSLLAFGSETPDNIACAERIEFGQVQMKWGLKLVHSPILLSDIIQQLIGEVQLTKELKELFPDTSSTDWKSAMSFAFLVLQDLTQTSGLIYKMKEVHENGLNDRLDQHVLKHINHQKNIIIQKLTRSTPNINPQKIIDNIEFGHFENNKIHIKRWGIKVKNYFFLSDLFSVLESSDTVPNALVERFALNLDDWQAFNRLMVLIFLAFEGNEYV